MTPPTHLKIPSPESYDALSTTALSAATQATAAAGLIPYAAGDHTTLPNGAGNYRIMTGSEAGQVWERQAGGALVRRGELEAASSRANIYRAADKAAIQALIPSLPQPPAGIKVVANDTGRRFIIGALVGGQYILIPDDNGKLDAASFGVLDDVQMIDTASTSAASATLTAATSGSAVFFPADVGKAIVVLGKLGMVDCTAGSTTLRVAQHTLFAAGDVGKAITILNPGNFGTLLTTTITAVAADGRSATLAAAPASSHGRQVDGSAPDPSLRAHWGGLGTGGTPLDTTIAAVASDGLSCTLAAPAVLAASALHAEWGTDCTDALTTWISLLGPQKPGIINSIGTGVIWTRKAWNLKDRARIKIQDDLTLRIKPNAFERTDERTQTAMITGDNAYTLSSANGTNNIKIWGARLTLDVNYQYAPMAMLGGLRFIGAQQCRVERVSTIGISSPNAGEVGFGVLLAVSPNGPDVTGNWFERCTSQATPEWFLPDGINVNQVTLAGFQLYSPVGGTGKNGADIDESRSTANGYLPGRAYRNTFLDCSASGGSHGCYATNVYENTWENFTTQNCAHRGLIFGYTCDRNLIIKCRFNDTGSTGLQFAYDCRDNRAVDTTSNGVRGTEGNGFKVYVFGSGNTFTNCQSFNAAAAAFRVAHGAHDNHFYGCKSFWSGSHGNYPNASPDAASTAWQLTRGFLFEGASEAQWLNGLNLSVMQYSYGNTANDCVASGSFIGFYLDSYVNTAASSVAGNVWNNTHAVGCGTGYDWNRAKAVSIRGNQMLAARVYNNTIDYPAGLTDAFTRVTGSGNLADKGGNPSGDRQPEWDGYAAWTDDTTQIGSLYQPPSGYVFVGYACAVRAVAAGGTLNMRYSIGTTGAGLTAGLVGVYRASDNARLAVSADLSASWNGATGAQTTPLTVSTAIAAGDFLYLAVLAVGTTTPVFVAAGGSSVINLVGVRRGYTSGQTTLPATLPGLAGNIQTPWLALS